MLEVGCQKVGHCGGITRRALLHAGWLSVLPWTGRLLHAGTSTNAAKAKHVILLWLWGGPSHLDMWDMKPAAPLEYRGPYAPVATSVPGIQISELLPEMARRAHEYTILRSLHHDSNDHGIAGTIGLTASQSGAISLSGQVMPGRVLPAQGSVIAKLIAEQRGLPNFVTIGGHLHQGKRRIAGEGASFLGGSVQPFRIDYQPGEGVDLPQLKLHDGTSPDGLQSRHRLLQAIDAANRTIDATRSVETMDRYYQQAFSLLTSGKAREVFDLESEPPEMRERYGYFRFGQCCLLARRLVEAGVRFVQVNWSSHVEPIEDTGDGGWDMHDRNFPQLQDRHCWMLDQAYAALLDDLRERGLLQETIVVAIGEFGRTPKINNKAGRDHWQQCYSAVIAGGGIPGGQVIGASDARAEHPSIQPITPGDLWMTVLHRMGFGSFELTSAGLAPTGEVIEQLA